jgi:hypothetical protein
MTTGSARLIGEPDRWARYIRDSLIGTTIARDVLLLSRVDKPAVLRRLFELGCAYSGQILSYTKMVGQLQDAANMTTFAHYLKLLAGAGMVSGPAEVRSSRRPPAGQFLATASGRRFHIQIVTSRSVGGKGDPLPIRRPDRKLVVARVASETSPAAAEQVEQPHVHVGLVRPSSRDKQAIGGELWKGSVVRVRLGGCAE